MADKRIYELTEATEAGANDMLALDNSNFAEAKKIKVSNFVKLLANKYDVTTLLQTGSTNTTGGTITKGTFFYLNGDLCVAIADIASGATFTFETNYTYAEIGQEIASVKKTLSPIINYDVSEIAFLMTWAGTFISQPASTRGITTSTTLTDLITGVLINTSKNKVSARYIINTNSGSVSTNPGCPTLLRELYGIFGSTVEGTVNTFIIDIIESTSGVKRSYITHFKGSSLMERCAYYYDSSSSQWVTGTVYSISLTARNT